MEDETRRRNGFDGVATSYFIVLEAMAKKIDPSLDTLHLKSTLISIFTANCSQ